MLKRVVLKISGQVQGVLYRVKTKEKAGQLNIKGFVQNELDGTVKIVAEGEENSLKELIEWCYQGSLNAKVTKIDTVWENYKKNFKNFEILK